MTTYGTPQFPFVNKTGLITGSAVAYQLPDVPCLRAKLKAQEGSIGRLKIGASSTTIFWELGAGDELDWIDVDNLNRLWMTSASGTADKLLYWIQV